MENLPKMSQSELEKAPFNEQSVPYRRFSIEVSYTLRKEVVVTTDDYVQEYDYESCCPCINTEHTDWESAYLVGHYSIPQLIDQLKDYIRKDIERISELEGMTIRVRNLQDMLDDCDNWEVVEEEYG